MIDSIDNLCKNKVLICAKSTKQIIALLSQTDFIQELADRGYSWLTITSKTGALLMAKRLIEKSSLILLMLGVEIQLKSL